MATCLYVLEIRISKYIYMYSIILGYSFGKPDSMEDEKLKRQLEYHIAARQGPMTGLGSKWDYEKGQLPRFIFIDFLNILYLLF